MLVLGVDENGLGPRLGPLVATAVLLRTGSYRRAAWCSRGRALGLTDSKETGGFGRMRFIESVALALLSLDGRATPTGADALLERVWPQSTSALRACCPDDRTAAQCWAVDVPLPVFGGDPGAGIDLIDRLVGRSSLAVLQVESRVACAGVLNAERAVGRNKLDVDLALFETLIASAREHHEGPLLAICGMVGGIRDYPSRLRRFEGADVRTLSSRRGQRRYLVRDVGELRFEVDADARHLPVALASIVGKYVREVGMLRIAEFYRRSDPTLNPVSGYHDSLTSRFIERTRTTRRNLAIAPDCFQRHA